MSLTQYDPKISQSAGMIQKFTQPVVASPTQNDLQSVNFIVDSSIPYVSQTNLYFPGYKNVYICRWYWTTRKWNRPPSVPVQARIKELCTHTKRHWQTITAKEMYQHLYDSSRHSDQLSPWAGGTRSWLSLQCWTLSDIIGVGVGECQCRSLSVSESASFRCWW